MPSEGPWASDDDNLHREPLRSALDSARAFLANSRSIAELDDDAQLKLVAMGTSAGKLQQNHLQAAGAAALVSIAESLALVADALRDDRP